MQSILEILKGGNKLIPNWDNTTWKGENNQPTDSVLQFSTYHKVRYSQGRQDRLR